MHWSLEPFSAAHAALAASGGRSGAAVLAAVADVAEDVKRLFAAPPKSTASRDRLAQHGLTLDGAAVAVDAPFLELCVRLADELNLDELVCAELVHAARRDARRIGFGAVESAAALFYTRRALIVDILRYCVEVLPSDDLGAVLPAQRVEHLLDALRAVEQSLADLDEKAKTNAFMGLGGPPFASAQRAYLREEHAQLAHVLYAYVRTHGARDNSAAAVRALLRRLTAATQYDAALLAYLPAAVQWLAQPHAAPFLQAAHAALQAPWPLEPWRGAVALVFYAGLADEWRPEFLPYAEVCARLRAAVDAGGLEFCLAAAQDAALAAGALSAAREWPLLRVRVPRLELRAVPAALPTALALVASLVITTCADLLKEMRLCEEDVHLYLGAHDDEQAHAGVDLERFFLLVAAVCERAPEQAELFFVDKSDAFYGFLVWGADARVPFMAAAFAQMLGALANSARNCGSVHRFLLRREPRREDALALSWESVYEVLEHYLRGFAAPDAPGLRDGRDAAGARASPALPSAGTALGVTAAATSATGAPAATAAAATPFAPFAPNTAASSRPPSVGPNASVPARSALAGDLAGHAHAHAHAPAQRVTAGLLSEDARLVVSAYARLVGAVVAQCPEALVHVRGQVFDAQGEPMDILPLLLKLLKLGIPSNGAVLRALVPFANADVWPALDACARQRWDEVLPTPADVLSFVQLVARLAALGEYGAHFDAHVDFALTTAFAGSQQIVQTDVRYALQLACFDLLAALFDADAPAAAPHTEHAFRLCFATSVCAALFAVLAEPVDVLDALPADHVIVRKLTRAVQLVSTLLARSRPPLYAFDKPVLYNLEIVPYIALYLSSRHAELALASIELFSRLQTSSEFGPTVERQSRVLSILTSTTESPRIRVDMLSLLRDARAPSGVKAALLRMILSELSELKSARYPVTVAHFLLGFRQAELGMEPTIELDGSMGGVRSSSSVFGSVCELLVQALACANAGTTLAGAPCSPAQSDALPMLRLTSAILGALVADPLTSQITLDYLRPLEFVLLLVRRRPARAIAGSDDLYEYRAVLLNVLKRELQACQQKLLLTLEKHYLDAIAPVIFSFVDFESLPADSSLSALKCMQEWCLLVPVLVRESTSTELVLVVRVMKTLVEYLPAYSRRSTRFAKPLASLLVLLLDRYVVLCEDAAEVVPLVYRVLEGALLAFQPAQIDAALRTELYSLILCALNVTSQGDAPENVLQLAYNLLLEAGPVAFEAISADVLDSSSEALQVGGLVVLELALALEQRLHERFVVDQLLRINFVAVFVTEIFLAALEKPEDEHVLRIALMLLLQVAHDPAGASALAASSLVAALGAKLAKLPPTSLLLAVRTLVALVATLGANARTRTQVADLVSSNQSVLDRPADEPLARSVKTLKDLVCAQSAQSAPSS